MIIANQNKNLFKPVASIEDLEIYREEVDINCYTGADGYKYASPVYGDWLFRIQNKIYARYKTREEKEYVLKCLVKSFIDNNTYFIFPEQNKIVVKLEA